MLGREFICDRGQGTASFVTRDREILLLSMLINITPGSVTIDLSGDRRTLYVHVMHVTTAEQSRHEIKSGFEHRVKRLFE